MVADALAPSVRKWAAATIMTIVEKCDAAFHKEGFYSSASQNVEIWQGIKICFYVSSNKFDVKILEILLIDTCFSMKRFTNMHTGTHHVAYLYKWQDKHVHNKYRSFMGNIKIESFTKFITEFILSENIQFL